MFQRPARWNFFVLMLTGLVILALFQWSLFQRTLVIREAAKRYKLEDPNLHFLFLREKVERWERRIAEQKKLERLARVIISDAEDREIDTSSWKRPYTQKSIDKWRHKVASQGVRSSFLQELKAQAGKKKLSLDQFSLPITDKHAGLWSIALDNLETVVVRSEQNESFEIMRIEVTQGLYQVLTGENPSSNKNCGATCPVDQITFQAATLFANLLSQAMSFEECSDMENKQVRPACLGWRLPTEEEWVLAADEPQLQMDLVAWHLGNSPNEIQAVRGLQPNKKGVFDMYGNVSEWIWSDSAEAVHLGGSVKHIKQQLKERFVSKKEKREKYIGFRLVKTFKTFKTP